jgi:uncharacterized RDD family membrane protein YckC
MTKTISDFKEYYSSLTTDELVEIKMKGTLLEEAEKAIDEVMSLRNVDLVEEVRQVKVQNQVKADDRLAPIGARLGARVVDFFVVSLLILPFGLLGIGMPVAILIFLYPLFMDSLPNGQSLGKIFFNIAVINEKTGKYCRINESFFRNLTLIGGICDWLFIFGKRRKRLGDFVAGTIVINTKKR